MKKSFLFATALFASASMMAATIQVEPGENTIKDALATAQAGDVLELSTGNYTEWSSYIQDKAITIKAAEGAKPVVALYAWRITTDFELDGLTINNVSKDNYLLRTGGDVAGTITIKNCTLNNKREDTTNPTPYIYLSSNTVGTLVIDNCVFSDNDKADGAIVYGSSAKVTNFTMTNSTAYNQAGELAVRLGAVTNATVDHCTLYNCGTRPIYLNGVTTCDVKNCAVVAPEAVSVYCIATYGGTVQNCLYYNLDAPRSTSATVTGCINADPQFTDAAHADFSFTKDSPLYNAATDETCIGDPRWAPKNDPTAIEQVENGKSIKRVENGQLIIIRDGVRYNGLGNRL